MNRSPLRYPGGKSSITPLIKRIIESKENRPITYIEPFAGGAGVAINLLLDEIVENVVINDYDKAIYSFWRALKEETDALISMIEDTPVTVDEWHRQKAVYTDMNKKYSLQLGFAAFYLNRTNRSGILKAGPIGGYAQAGDYNIDARFNKQALISRISAIAQKKSAIIVYNKEIRKFIEQVVPRYQNNALIYFDPPYYVNGKRLYKNFFVEDDHREISDYIRNNVECDWVITYDDEPEMRAIYCDYPMCNYQLTYSAANKGKGTELIVFKNRDLVPSEQVISRELKQFSINAI